MIPRTGIGRDDGGRLPADCGTLRTQRSPAVASSNAAHIHASTPEGSGMVAQSPAVLVTAAEPTARATFVRRVYVHLALAILAFVAIEWLLLQWDAAEDIAEAMTDGFNWLLVLLAFTLVSNVADRWARSNVSEGRQYLGLGIFIVAEAVLFLPLILGVSRMEDGDDVFATAGVITLALVAGLTAVVIITRQDFSFLRSAIAVGSLVGLGLIVASILFGFSLGLWFSLAMVILAGGSILYNTSNIFKRYRTSQHVAAALALFSSIALLFWYVLQIVARRR
jgi:FtsH-binding integral membrane protein